jgi:3-oxoacyl-[acyl-carrier protein] reductase
MSNVNASHPLAGRVALVTGAAQGLGAAIAETLHAAGARVALADLQLDSAAAIAHALDPSGETALAREVDVRDRDSFATAANDAAAALGPIGILVNNAGVMVRRSLWEIETAEWDDVLAVNLRSVLFGCQVLAPSMRERGWGRIINLSSLAGQQGGLVAGAHYAAAKAGILTLTKVAAADLASSGVTVNAIAPAAIEGPAMDALPAELREQIPARIPVGRVATAAEVAALAAFLCGPDAGYITGATLDINGGAFMR